MTAKRMGPGPDTFLPTARPKAIPGAFRGRTNLQAGVASGAWGSGLLLVALGVYSPTWLTGLKVILVVVAVAGVLVWLFRDRHKLRFKPLSGPLAMAGVGAVYTVYGLAAGNPGAGPASRVYVAWVIVLALLAAAVTSQRKLRIVLGAVVWGAALAVMHGTLYCLASAGLLPEFLLRIPVAPNTRYVQLGGMPMPSASFGFLGSLLYAIPICACLLTAPSFRLGRWVPRWLLWVTTVLGVFVTILSGRRAVELVSIATPLLWLVLMKYATGRWFGGRAVRPVLMTLGTTIAALAVVLGGFVLSRPLQYDMTGVLGSERVSASGRGDVFSGGGAGGQLLTDFSEGFAFGGTKDGGADDAAVRAKQAGVLWGKFMERPVFGWGLGADTPGFTRSESQPWAYELTYLVWLMNFGVLGTLAYFLAFTAILVKLRQGIRAQTEMTWPLVAVGLGMVCFLLGNATNPYLAKFDGLLPVFLALAGVYASAETMIKKRPKNPPIRMP